MTARFRTWARVGLAGPGAVLVALAVMAGMACWLPAGTAGIDNLVLPLVLVPLIWAALFFHACLDDRLGRVAIVFGALFVLHAGLVGHAFLTGPAGREAAR